MRKLSFMITGMILFCSFSSNAQQTNIDLPASTSGNTKESDVEYTEHTKIGISPVPNGGIRVRIVEYTNPNDGTQVIAKSLPNEIIREVNCNCTKLVRFTKKDYLLATNLYYEDEKDSAIYSLSDGKYKIEFLKRETEETLYTMVVVIDKENLIIKKEFKSLINNSDAPIKIKKRTPQYIYINFND